jgi:DNA-binding NarL/FixJ family response regulator
MLDYNSVSPRLFRFMIRLLLVDDQTLVRQGFRVLLEAQTDLQVIGEAENGAIAISQVEAHQPDVILMDVRMPEMDGVAATQIIHQQFPKTKILVLSTFDDDDYVYRAMQFGASGYLLKDAHIDEVVHAIRLVHKGHIQFGPGLFEKAMLPPVPAQSIPTQPVPTQSTAIPLTISDLTPRERQVLCLVITGSTNREIAQSLYISERTVKNHITSILSRLNVRDRAQAAMFASPFLSFLQDQ